MSAKQTLRQWIAEGELELAIQSLQQIANQLGNINFINDVTHQAGRYASLKKKEQQNIIDERDAGIELAKIRQALLDLINKVPDHTTLESSTDAPILVPGQEPVASTTPPTDNPNSIQNSLKNLWIVGLGVLVGVTLLAALIPCPSDFLSGTTQVLMAMGAAMAATALPGLLNIDLPNVKTGSALAVLVLVYLFNPAKLVENNTRCNQPQYTSVTVFVHGKNGKQDMILRQQGAVVMDVSGGERKRASINENGQAFFQNLQVGDTVQLNVDFSEPYKATHPDAKYVVENQGSIYLETALQGLDKVFGTVLDGDNPIADVLVSIGALRDTTDETGYFEIRVPENLQQQQQEVKFTKRGYKMTTKTAYPQTNAPLNVVLSK